MHLPEINFDRAHRLQSTPSLVESQELCCHLADSSLRRIYKMGRGKYARCNQRKLSLREQAGHWPHPDLAWSRLAAAS